MKSRAVKITRMTHSIDAANQSAGRLATRIAQLLMGKNKPSYQRHIDGGDIVLVSNAGKIKITGKKLTGKHYHHFSGYPGGLKSKKLSEVMEKDPSYVIKNAVWNMLPKNKLRAEMIKRLRFSK